MLDLLFDEVPCLLVRHEDPLVGRYGSKCSTGVIHLFHSFLFISLHILADLGQNSSHGPFPACLVQNGMSHVKRQNHSTFDKLSSPSYPAAHRVECLFKEGLGHTAFG